MNFFKLLHIPLLASVLFFSCGKSDKKPEFSDENSKNTLQKENKTEADEKKSENSSDVTQDTQQNSVNEKPSTNKQNNKQSFQNEKPVAVISPLDAGDYNGKTVTVKGFVADIYKSEKVAYLNFVEKYPKNPFTAVIFARQFEDFPDIAKLRNKDVEVTGRVSFYNGKPQIILNSPSQLSVK
jgi:DNA/RNA endonuclease YhcR with UshA esterase domain